MKFDTMVNSFLNFCEPQITDGSKKSNTIFCYIKFYEVLWRPKLDQYYKQQHIDKVM